MVPVTEYDPQRLSIGRGADMETQDGLIVAGLRPRPALRDQAMQRITRTREQNGAGLEVAERCEALQQQQQQGPRLFLVNGKARPPTRKGWCSGASSASAMP
jgi:hypothetical protein